MIRMMYSWTDVAQRTERVYDGISGVLSEADFYGYDAADAASWSATRGRAGVQSFALIDRLKRYYGCGIWAGKLFCLCVVIDYLLFLLLEILAPREKIDIARNWPKKNQDESKERDREKQREVG
jgi:phosphatidylinositol glycan class A protein